MALLVPNMTPKTIMLQSSAFDLMPLVVFHSTGGTHMARSEKVMWALFISLMVSMALAMLPLFIIGVFETYKGLLFSS